jgi:hypothetical protein
MVMNDKKVSKMADFKMISRHLPENTEESHKHLIQDRR